MKSFLLAVAAVAIMFVTINTAHADKFGNSWKTFTKKVHTGYDTDGDPTYTYYRWRCTNSYGTVMAYYNGKPAVMIRKFQGRKLVTWTSASQRRGVAKSTPLPSTEIYLHYFGNN